jgi:hypothetical protein
MSTLTCSQIWQSLLEDHWQPTNLTKLAKEKTCSSCACRFLFLFQFCDAAQVVIIHKMLLARFGYRLDMKVKKKKNDPSIFLATYWNLY